MRLVLLCVLALIAITLPRLTVSIVLSVRMSGQDAVPVHVTVTLAVVSFALGSATVTLASPAPDGFGGQVDRWSQTEPDGGLVPDGSGRGPQVAVRGPVAGAIWPTIATEVVGPAAHAPGP